MTTTAPSKPKAEDFYPGAEWTFTHPATGEVRRYAIEEVHRGNDKVAPLYKLRNLAKHPEPFTDPYDKRHAVCAWATHGTLCGATSTKGWARS